MSRSFHPEIEQELESMTDPDLRSSLVDYLREHRKPAVRWRRRTEDSRSVGSGPLRRLLGWETAPVLDVDASKFGGVPYLERAEDWPRGSDGEPAPFIGQLNFAQMEAPDDFPDQGLFVVFEHPDDDARYPADTFAIRWYPEAAPERAAALDWRDWPLKTETPVELTPADSFDLPHHWSDVLPFESRSQLSDADDTALVRVMEAILDVGGNIGALPYFALRADEPRTFGPEMNQRLDEDEDFLMVWTPMRGASGYFSIMIRPEDFHAGRLDRCHTMWWQ